MLREELNAAGRLVSGASRMVYRYYFANKIRGLLLDTAGASPMRLEKSLAAAQGSMIFGEQLDLGFMREGEVRITLQPEEHAMTTNCGFFVGLA